MKAFLLIIICLLSASAENITWDEMSKTDKYDVLWELDYTPQDQLPADTKSINLLKELSTYPEHQAYFDAALITLDEIDRESIEQSPYSTHGPEELIEFIILLKNNEVLGARIYMYQDGRDENGEDSDVNWGASVTLGSDADFFKDENGEAFDDLRFEWSGH